MPTIEELEEYIAEVESYIASLLPALEQLPSLPQRIFDELQRFGPPSLPSFPTLIIQAPAPPPPPPPPPEPKGWIEWMGDAVGGGSMRRLTVGVVLSAGLGLAGMYGWKRYRLHLLKKRKGRKSLRATPLMTDGHRREAIVVLGADHPLGQPICASLERQGYIVLATTASPAQGSKLLKSSTGYLRTLALEPAAPVLPGTSVQTDATPESFPSKLQVALSQRFPTTAAGDPYVSAQHLPYVTGVISLLSLPSPAPAPVQHLPMKEQYLPHLISTHYTPLLLLQSLIPEMRRSPLGRTPTIITLLPALSGLAGTPFGAAGAAVVQANKSMLSSLRRELAQANDPTKLITLNIGAIALPSSASDGSNQRLPKEAEGAYGTAFSAALASVGQRGWTNPNRVTRAIGRILRHADSPLGKIVYWIKAGEINIGAGAHVYALASRLPAPVLDVIFSIPAWVATLRLKLAAIPFPAIRPQLRRTLGRRTAKREDASASTATSRGTATGGKLAIEPAPAPAPPSHPAVTPTPAAAPVNAELAAGSGVPVPEETLSEVESDLSIDEPEHEHSHDEQGEEQEHENEQAGSGSESEWEKVRSGGEGACGGASRVDTPSRAVPEVDAGRV